MPVVRFSLLRLALFGAALVVLWRAGMGGWLLVVVAAVVAGALSYVLFGRQRTAAATWIAERRAARRPRFGAGVAADEAVEDAAADAAADAATNPAANADAATNPATNPATRDG